MARRMGGELILQAAAKRPREVLMGPGPLAIWLKVIAPGFRDWLTYKVFLQTAMRRARAGKIVIWPAGLPLRATLDLRHPAAIVENEQTAMSVVEIDDRLSRVQRVISPASPGEPKGASCPSPRLSST